MSDYISYRTNDKNNSERLGSNGSAAPILHLFLVAYASAKYPDSKRARGSVIPINGAAQANPSVKVSYRPAKDEDFKQLLALSANGCFWVAFNTKTALSGHFQKPAACPLYKALLIPAILLETLQSRITIPAKEVEEIADAWQKMLPHLKESPAYKTLEAVTTIAIEASALHAELVIS